MTQRQSGTMEGTRLSGPSHPPYPAMQCLVWPSMWGDLSSNPPSQPVRVQVRGLTCVGLSICAEEDAYCGLRVVRYVGPGHEPDPILPLFGEKQQPLALTQVRCL